MTLAMVCGVGGGCMSNIEGLVGGMVN